MGSLCAARSGTICCSLWQKSCCGLRAVYAFVLQKTCPDLGTRCTWQWHWTGVGLSTQSGGPETPFQRSLQDWSLHISRSKDWLWKAGLIRLNPVTLLNIPEQHQGRAQSARPWFGYLFHNSQDLLQNEHYLFAHLKIRGQCSDAVSHHMLKFVFVLYFWPKAWPDFKESHEHEVQAEGPKWALSTSATGKSNQAKNDWR